jgi:hypothetical protein
MNYVELRTPSAARKAHRHEFLRTASLEAQHNRGIYIIGLMWSSTDYRTLMVVAVSVSSGSMAVLRCKFESNRAVSAGSNTI